MEQEEADGSLAVYSPTTNLWLDLVAQVDDHRARPVPNHVMVERQV